MPIDLKKISHEAAGLVTAVCLINETVAKVATGLLKKKKQRELVSLFITDDLSRGSGISYFCARQMVSVRRTEQEDALLSTRRGYSRPLRPAAKECTRPLRASTLSSH